MEAVGLALSAVQTLLAALNCPQLNDIRSIFDYKSQIDDLKRTVEFLKSVLSDAAEIKQDLLSNQEKVDIDEIKDVVYEADDLFDEFVTLVQQKQLLKDDGRVSENLRRFFSRSNNPVSVAYRMNDGVNKIKKKLDAIATYKQFSFNHYPQPIRNFNHDPQPIRNRSRDTCSYVNQVDIVGRGDDLEKIVGMLLPPSNDQRHNVNFLSVVGLGGLGKTALAQLVFNDPRVQSAFSWRKWTCVADQDQKELDVNQVLCKILEREGSTMEQAQSQLREKLAGERYLHVLDDVWTEKQFQWRELVTYLSGGQKGSWIVVTTRSHKTAEIVGGQVHKLQGLSKENSWSLFQQSAFTSNPPDELVKIGRKIVDKCAGVPLAIKVVGSFLYGQDRGKWNLVQEKGLANIRQSDNDILLILKLSFHHLEAPLKSCFAYCALFPKDFVMEKEMLKSLWMAQGYVVPLDEGQSIEDACEEYFSILLRRCFFQDIKKDNYGEIYSCKIHDLMHDIALDVSGKEIFCATNTIGGNLDKKVRHLFCERLETMRERGNYSLFGKSRIRSYLHIGTYIKKDTQFLVDAIVANCRFLRALDLSLFGIESLPGCMGELLHLRYLDLSHNKGLHELPKSFTKLYNLQTLKLEWCKNLTELPKDFSRLVKLRLLDVEGCDNLTYMPKGMSKMTCLDRLSDFKVGGGGSSLSWKQWFDSLEDLKALNKLKGSLKIMIKWPKRYRNIVKEDGDKREGLYMRDKEHLNAIWFYFKHEVGDDGGKDKELSLMEDLQPHSNLKKLSVWHYKGVKMPGWLTLVKNMVTLHVICCRELEYLPCLGNLRNLKYIELHDLAKLEYIGVDDTSWANSNTTMPMSGLRSSDKELSFFPSLEEVKLWNLPKLKGWKRGVLGRVEDNNLQSQQLLPCFSKLQTLTICDCPELTSLPSCPGLEDLSLWEFNKGLQIMNKKRDEVAPASSSASTSCFEIVNPKLQRFEIDNMASPISLPSEYFHCVKTLTLWKVNEEMDMPNWMLFLPALQTLEFNNCRELKAIPKWMPKLTSLTTLSLFGYSESLKRRCKKDPPGEDWPYIQHIPHIQFKESLI